LYADDLLFRLACHRDPDLPSKSSSDAQDSADFLKDARGAELSQPENLDPADLRAPRGTTEVIARRIMSQQYGKKRNDP
jgi:hypothetical protein